MRQIRDVHPGKPISAKDFNYLLEQVQKLANLSAEPPLELIQGCLRLIPQDFYAVLVANPPGSSSSSSSNPCCKGNAYSWQDVEPDGMGGWDAVSGGRSGTPELNPAYEVNGNCIDVGTIVRMRSGIDGEYLFEQCCSPCNPIVPIHCNELIGLTFDLTWDVIEQAFINDDEQIRLYCDSGDWILSICNSQAYAPDTVDCNGLPLLTFDCITSGCCDGPIGAVISGATSSSSSSGGSCPCDNATFCVSYPDVIQDGGVCPDCTNMENAVTMTKQSDAYIGICNWWFGFTEVCSPNHLHSVFWISGTTAFLAVRTNNPPTPDLGFCTEAAYSADISTWNCATPLTMDKAWPGGSGVGDCGACGNWPTTVIVAAC